MNTPGEFFDAVRLALLGPNLSQSETDGLGAILAAMDGAPISHCAYALATAYKETNHTMQPINEIGGDAYFFRRYDPHGPRPDIARQLGNTEAGDGAKYHGRGYVQLTGRRNYSNASAELGVPLLDNPALALEPDIAAKVMRRGMDQGWFTGRGFARYLPMAGSASRAAFMEARRIINGQDCADEIAGYAMQFQAALQEGGWA